MAAIAHLIAPSSDPTLACAQVKLAKLTKQKVIVSSKEPGKPRQDVEVEYGQAEGSNLAPAKEYAQRAFQEAVGASVALNAAVEFLQTK